MRAIPFRDRAPMLLQRTEKARRELSPGVRTLSLRERSLLLLADGKPLSELQAMYNGTGAEMVDHLLHEGYLANLAATESASIALPAPETPLEAPEPITVFAAAAPVAPAAAETTRPADAAESGRSLAGARMYLFDMCERMFARRDPALANSYRDALREARDQHSMLEVGQALLADVAKLAGDERADSIRERLEQLLPSERALSAAASG